MNRTQILLAGTAGAALLARARTSAAQRANPPRGRFAGGLHFVEQGIGVPVVLLHGLGSSLDDWMLSGLVNQAGARYHVLAFDRPGYGHSPRPRTQAWTPLAQARALHAALQDLGIARPIVVGHSWAAQVAIAYGLAYPDAVRGLVLASGYYYPTLRLDAPFLVPPAIPLLGALLRHSVSPVMGRLLWPLWLRLLFAPLPVPGYFSQRFPAWMSLRPESLRAVGEESAMLLPLSARMRRHYSKLRVPSVIVAGTHDRFVGSAGHSGRLHAALPGSRLVAVPGAGHMAHHAAPESILEAVGSLA